MYGFRARIGLIIPSLNTTIEPEFNAMVPKEVSVHASRLLFEGGIEGLRLMAEGTQEAAKLLATAGVDVIAYGCTAGSLIKGVGWDREIVMKIEGITGIRATTTSTAVISAFEELGVRKVAIASPYNQELNQLEKQFFEGHGIEVVNMKGLDIHGETLRHALPETTYKLACEVDIPDAEVVFISCTNFKSITVIEKLEEDLGKYVFSSNTATLWDVLRKLGLSDQIEGYGKLFNH